MLERLTGCAGEMRAGQGEQLALVLRCGSAEAHFRVVARRRLGKEAAAQLVAHLPEEAEETIAVARHVTPAGARIFRKAGIGYLDAAGNSYVRSGGLFIFISGRKTEDGRGERRIRAFLAAGLKVIFVLLARPDLARRPYRAIAQAAGVSRGAVGYIMGDLEELGYVEQSGGERVLRGLGELTRRWARGYAETLRPKLVRGRFRFARPERMKAWKEIALDLERCRWGGEPAADLLTGYLRPETLTFYTRGDTKEALQVLEAIPDPDGPIEILDLFWKPEGLAGETPDVKRAAHPLVVYADLIDIGAPRALKVARMIYDEWLDGEEA